MQAQQQIKFQRQLVQRQTIFRYSSVWIPGLLQRRQVRLGVCASIIQQSGLSVFKNIIIRSLRMITNLKLKVRANKEQAVPARRIKTEMNENSKKISFYLNKSKAPLAENKKIINENDTITLKKPKPVKSIALKQTNTTKLNTEAHNNQRLTNAHRLAMDKIFGQGKKENIPIMVSHSINKKQKEEKQGSQSSRLVGAARYACEDKVGNGTFGVVHKARDRKTLQIVAIKRVFQDKKYKNRQLQILKGLNHPNTLKIRDSFFTYQQGKQYLNVVMDYFPSNLYESIQKYRRNGQISLLKLKAYAYQMFRGLLYLNSIDIAHRDIKPQNVLVNDQTCNLIICDFGSAKKLQPGQPNLAYICSRCYRAPQLIFGSTNYTTQIDMWSAGCILVEMIMFEPIFKSESNIDQLVEIIKVLGTPSYEEIMEMNEDCKVQNYQFPKINPRSWEKILKKKDLGKQFYDLLYRVLKYSPQRRITPFEALQHPFFDQLKEQQEFIKLRKQYPMMMDLFDFKVTKEVTSSQVSSLVPKWYR